MIARQVRRTLRHRLAEVPAVGLIGPRQSGKTTLAKSLAVEYYDLEQETERLRLDLDWSRLESGRRLVALDEAQAWPEVFSRLRGAIDRDRRRFGRFLLLGSVSPALMTEVSESLAGRLSLVELTPLLWGELESAAQRRRLWLDGGFPDGGVLKGRQYPRWQHDYLTLLVQRDLPSWGLPARPQIMGRLLRMVAGAHGQVWNASAIGRSLGLSYHTVDSYLDYLEGAFLIRRLRPLHANLRKRLVKSPKVFWRDSGLLHATLGVLDERDLLGQPWVGASWEGFVIEQVLGALAAEGLRHDAWFLRTSDGHELDLVVDVGGQRWALEIKLTASPSPRDMTQVDRLGEMIGATRRYVVSQVEVPSGDLERASCNLPWLLARIRSGTSS